MEFRAVIRATASDRAVLVSTHMLSEARLLCDRVVVMSDGTVVYNGATTDFAGEGTTEAVEEAFRLAVQR
jgi:ABC-2 type transport system ATP-binding protein